MANAFSGRSMTQENLSGLAMRLSFNQDYTQLSITVQMVKKVQNALLLAAQSDLNAVCAVKLSHGNAHHLTDPAYGGNTWGGGPAEKIAYVVGGRIHLNS